MYKHILVPVDGSAAAERGLREAIALAADQKARLTVLHVLGEFALLAETASPVSYADMMAGLRTYGKGLLDKAVGRAAEAGVQADAALREVPEGRIAEVVVEEAGRGNCDLIVMGTHGRRGLQRVAMGSEAEQVVRTSQIPVLLLRGQEPKLFSA